MNSPRPAPSDRYLPPMLLLFIGSGCAALIYEIVWLQVLQLVIGASAISLATLLATFMGGMFAGSLLLAEPCGARIPIIDFPREPGTHLPLDLVDLDQPAALDFGKVRRNE